MGVHQKFVPLERFKTLRINEWFVKKPFGGEFCLSFKNQIYEVVPDTSQLVRRDVEIGSKFREFPSMQLDSYVHQMCIGMRYVQIHVIIFF